MKVPSPAGHWLFQLANTLLFLSYVSPDVLFLRLVLMAAGLCFVLWGSISFSSVAVDTVVWNAMFCVINAYRAAELAWQRRPIRFEIEEHEEVYAEVFGPVGIGRLKFRMLMEQGLLRKLRAGSTFIEHGNDATNLTLLYQGSFSIISHPKDGRPPEKVGTVRRMQFVESPQWANMQMQRRKRAALKAAAELKRRRSISTTSLDRLENGLQQPNLMADQSSYLQGGALQLVEVETVMEDDIRAASLVEVSFTADDDVTFFTWPIERLQDFISKNPELSAPLNAIIGADVAAKLFSQSKGGEGEISEPERRIYLPLDEPSGPAILPMIESHVSPLETLDVIEHVKQNEEPGLSGKDLEQSVGGRMGVDQPSPLWAEKLWLEQRGARDTANDQKLAAILRSRTQMDKYEISVLLSKGRWRQIRREGTIVIREGEPTNFLLFILQGTFAVNKGEGGKARRLHTILPRQLIGSLELNEPEREHIAGETVVSLEPCSYIAWDLDDLRELLAPRPTLRARLTSLVAADLATKFRQMEENFQSKI